MDKKSAKPSLESVTAERDKLKHMLVNVLADPGYIAYKAQQKHIEGIVRKQLVAFVDKLAKRESTYVEGVGDINDVFNYEQLKEDIESESDKYKVY